MDRLRRGQTQNYAQNFRNFGETAEMGNNWPWFCKLYQSGSCTFAKDHESNGIMLRNIYANCLEKGRQLNHPKKISVV